MYATLPLVITLETLDKKGRLVELLLIKKRFKTKRKARYEIPTENS